MNKEQADRLPADLAPYIGQAEPPPSVTEPVKTGFDQLRWTCETYMTPAELDEVRAMWQYTYYYHSTPHLVREPRYLTRFDKTQYMTHLNETARILALEHQDYTTVMGALGHDLFEKTLAEPEEIEGLFGKPVVDLIDVATKVRDSVSATSAKIFSAIPGNIAGIHIKLADRLHNMRTVKYLPPNQGLSMARETLDLHCRLAQVLGIDHWAQELEDLAVQKLWPEQAKEAEILRKKYTDPNTAHAIYDLFHPFLPYISGTDSPDIGLEFHPQALSTFIIKDTTQPHVVDTHTVSLNVTCYNLELYDKVLQYFSTKIDALPKETVFTEDSKAAYIEFPYGANTYHLHIYTENGIKRSKASSLDSYRKPDPKDTYFSFVAGEAAKKVQELRAFFRTAQSSESQTGFVATGEEALRSLFITIHTPLETMRVPTYYTAHDLAYFLHTDIGNNALSAVLNGQEVSLDTPLTPGVHVEIKTVPYWTVNVDTLQSLKSSSMRAKARASLNYIRNMNILRDRMQDDDYAIAALNHLKTQVTPDMKKGEIERILENILQRYLPHKIISNGNDEEDGNLNRRTNLATLVYAMYHTGFDDPNTFTHRTREIEKSALPLGVKEIISKHEGPIRSDLDAAWHAVPPEIRHVYGTFSRFLIEVGLGNTPPNHITSYIEALRKEEEVYQPVILEVPNRQFILARLSTVAAVLANIISVDVLKNYDPDHLDRAKIVMMVKPTDPKLFDQLQATLQQMATNMINLEDGSKTIYENTFREIRLPLPDQLHLLSYLALPITMGTFIKEFINTEDGYAIIRFKAPKSDDSQITDEYIRQLNRELSLLHPN